MQQTRLIPLASFLGADLFVVGLGAVLLLRPDWLSYQAELAGREWSELEPAIQQLWLGQQKMLGSALLSGLALFAISELSSTVAELLAWPALMLTPGAMLALVVWAYATGRTRTGAGILAAYGAMFALALLLVAACFGMLMTYH